jgi:hypothetical protein
MSKARIFYKNSDNKGVYGKKGTMCSDRQVGATLLYCIDQLIIYTDY